MPLGLAPGKPAHGDDVGDGEQPGDGDARGHRARDAEPEDGDQDGREGEREDALADQDRAVGSHLLATVQDGHSEARHDRGRNDQQQDLAQLVRILRGRVEKMFVSSQGSENQSSGIRIALKDGR